MPRTLTIASKTISDDSDCYVIAEIGHNHQGNLDKARELFRAARDAGVDAVKLQKRDNRRLYTKAMYDKPYEHENSFGATYGAHREALEFGKKEYVELMAYAKELGVTMFSTPFDIPSADFLAELDVPVYKVASGDLKSLPLLEHIARFKRPMLISTGAAALEDIERTLDALLPINNQIAILQCTASYPTPPEEVNLRVISTLREAFPEQVVGFSDHYNGIAMAFGAYILGARIIEKHFTMNRAWKGTDHALSLEPTGMRKLVRDLRRGRVALGTGVKAPFPSEASALVKMGKKLVAARDLPRGHRLAAADIAMKSPGDGLPPYHLPQLLGKALKRDLKEDDALSLDGLEL
jgi:N-acetylneuraminate synthase/sialic acid synthase